MNKPRSTPPRWGQVVSIQRWDRWSVHHRLQELNIPCSCPADGTLQVEVNHAIALVLAQSTIRQFTDSRQVSVDWLERCWQSQVGCPANH